MKKILLIVLILLNVACKKENIFNVSPSTRTQISINNLKTELVNAANGWEMVYFPKTDSLLFYNLTEHIPDGFRNHFGYGGHTFLLKFMENGQVAIKADYNPTTIATADTCQYSIGQNSFTELSFITYCNIHKLVNEEYTGSCDFLYKGKDYWGNLVFSTGKYLEPAKEYIILKKLHKTNAWEEDLQQSFNNLDFFQQMENPQIEIYKGSRILFRSDYPTKAKYDPRDKENSQKEINKELYKRYRLFLFSKVLNPIKENYPKLAVGLGSGYTGSKNGLIFYPGIRYNKDYIFYNFTRVGNKFECEIVRHYDPYNNKFLYVSKDLSPNGEATGIKAVIYNLQKQ